MHVDHIPHPNTMWTMAQAMAFLGVKSRSTFYKRLAEWEGYGLPRPYFNINSSGTYEIRRFDPDKLRLCVEKAAEKSSTSQQEFPAPVQNQ
jgi:hypothetical protein